MLIDGDELYHGFLLAPLPFGWPDKTEVGPNNSCMARVEGASRRAPRVGFCIAILLLPSTTPARLGYWNVSSKFHAEN